jgi:hypothetical protein
MIAKNRGIPLTRSISRKRDFMANRTATLYIRIKTEDGKKPYCKPVYQSNGRRKPQFAMVNGEPEHRKEGVYHLRFGVGGNKQRLVLIGRDPRAWILDLCWYCDWRG